MKILGWRAWVDTPEGVVNYDSKDDKWEDMPDDGVIFIMLYKDDGDGLEENLNGHRYTHREGMCGIDFYFKAPHHSGTTYGSNNDTKEEIESRYPGAIVKRGKWVPASVFDKIQMEAMTYVW